MYENLKDNPVYLNVLIGHGLFKRKISSYSKTISYFIYIETSSLDSFNGFVNNLEANKSDGIFGEGITEGTYYGTSTENSMKKTRNKVIIF